MTEVRARMKSPVTLSATESGREYILLGDSSETVLNELKWELAA